MRRERRLFERKGRRTAKRERERETDLTSDAGTRRLLYGGGMAS